MTDGPTGGRPRHEPEGGRLVAWVRRRRREVAPVAGDASDAWLEITADTPEQLAEAVGHWDAEAWRPASGPPG